MPDPVFPSFSVPLSVEPWEEQIPRDPTITDEFEANYEQTYPAFERITDGWKLGLYNAPLADYTLMKDFERSVKVGCVIFTWTNPVNNQTYSVRFKEPVVYKMGANNRLWNITFVLKEV